MSQLPWGTSKTLRDDEFYNRDNEINLLTNLLESTGKANAPNILVTGVRGIGKTVLLKKIKKILDDDYLVIYMDLSMSQVFQKNKMSLKGILDYYCKEIITECKHKKLKTINHYLEKYFKTNDFNIGDFTNINGVPIPKINNKVEVEKYKELVFNLPQKIYEENKSIIKGVLIFVDEFQIIKELGSYRESFLWNYRGYISNQRNVGYVISASMSLQDKFITEISGDEGAFGNRMLTIHINPFSKEVVRNYLNERVPELLFDDNAFERFYNCTSGNPSYINIFARFLPYNQVLTEEDVINSFDNNLIFIAGHFISKWSRLTTKEKDIIIALIDGPIKRIDLAKKLNVQSGSLSEKLNKLQNLDLIRFRENKYELSEKLLKRWLEIEHDKLGIYPYRI